MVEGNRLPQSFRPVKISLKNFSNKLIISITNVSYIPSIRNLRRCRCVTPLSSAFETRGDMEMTYLG